jgi:glycosyltransferase involved in cell wall biosynthesis
VGPLELSLRERYPHVRWLGLLARDELARVYAAADVFVMPSQSETFGLVMLESMACGTPVAAYPVEGPLEVVGAPARGGVLDEDLAAGWYRALALPRHEARARAMDFSWAYASLLFLGHLVPAKRGQVFDRIAISHRAVT